jgi:DNA-binding beta-propeller fold protein YncE
MGRKPKSVTGGRTGLRKSRTLGLLSAILVCAAITYAAQQRGTLRLGKQPDGSFIVSTEQRIEPGSLPFFGRPIDMALHPSGTLAVLDHHSIVLISRERMSVFPLHHAAGFRGAVWSPDGKRLYVSMAAGYVQELDYLDGKLSFGRKIEVQPTGLKANPRPGGLAITRTGSRLFVAVLDRNSVAEINLTSGRLAHEYTVQNLPFEVKLSEDERTLIVTNWGGRPATEDDDQGNSGNAVIVVDPRGAAASGTVSLIRRESGTIKRVNVGLHPTAIAVQGNLAYITNAASDNLTEIDLVSQRALRTMPIKWGKMNLFGSMPCALAVRNGTAYICNGGDNAICEMDLQSGMVRGFRPAGYYPVAIALASGGKKAFVLNTKGNGSVARTIRGWAGSAHDFQGTVSTIDLSADLAATTDRVAANNGWNRDRGALRPNLAVYRGAIKHVLYIIKENRSYDEIFGDLTQGNGNSKLCYLGENITPNHHALARQFTLFDNAYVSGTNSADGHQWCTQALANDYLEHFYTGYRTYSFDGRCAMSISSAGSLWDAALKKGRSIRDYGEFCDAGLATFTPPTTKWIDVWKDRVSGKRAIETRAGTRIASLRPYIHKRVLCWPLLQSDQDRADLFIYDYNKMSKEKKVPNLMFLTLPCDHTQGRDPSYPKPQAMMADNDLAMGRVVEAVSKSPEWKNTCIFVIEDDAQFGLDHVDGHRTIYFALSPYTRRGFVDHELCNTVSMIRSIELMLGIDPMNRFDALTPPLAECFMDTPDFTPYTGFANRIALDDMNPPRTALKGQELYWTKRSLALDWSGLDRADPQVLNQVLWHTLRGVNTPYPAF